MKARKIIGTYTAAAGLVLLCCGTFTSLMVAAPLIYVGFLIEGSARLPRIFV